MERLFLGMNVLSFAGFAVIASSLALASRSNRQSQRQRVRSIVLVLMLTGTALVAFGIYLAPPLMP